MILPDIENFNFPAVKLSISGKLYVPESEFFDCDDLTIRTSWEQRGTLWYKRVEVEAKKSCLLRTISKWTPNVSLIRI